MCRKQIVARVSQTLSSPHCSGALARLRDEFGADSPEAVDNTITTMFAGFDTTSSTLSYLLFLLSGHPDVWNKAS
jgi:cytochrome P450